MSKIKVLIVTESISYGGLNIASVKFEEYLDKTKYECVYCVRRSQIGELEQAVLDRGVRVIHVPDSELNYLKSYRFYKRLMTEESYDIVHCHLPFFSGIVLMAAYKCGVFKRIAHAHFTQPYTDTEIYSKPKQFVAGIYRKVMRSFLKKYCNIKIACSLQAGNFLFGEKEFEKNGIVLNNGIDLNEYSFDIYARNSVRNDLHIPEDAEVLGHIGQLYSVKNQSFVIDVFNEYHKINVNSYLLLIGEGSDRERLEQKIQELDLAKFAFLLGARKDANKLYQAMDCFLFPSVHEGFPLTLIEAQASGLTCLISDNVNKKTKFNDNVEFLSINVSPKVWAERINDFVGIDRSDYLVSDSIHQFDIKYVINKLEELYSS